MKNKKISILVSCAFIAGIVFIGTAFDANEDQGLTPASVLKRIRRSGFTCFNIVYVTGGDTTWVEVARVNVRAKNPGYVYVQASGMIVIPDANHVRLSLDDTSATRGPWVFNMGDDATGRADEWETYGIGMVFYVPAKGTYTFCLNADSWNGDGSLISIQNGILSATWIDHRNVTYTDFGDLQIPVSSPTNH